MANPLQWCTRASEVKHRAILSFACTHDQGFAPQCTRIEASAAHPIGVLSQTATIAYSAAITATNLEFVRSAIHVSASQCSASRGVTHMKPIYIATGIAIFAALAFAIGPDVVRYIKISAM